MDRRAFLRAGTGLGVTAIAGSVLGRSLLHHDLTPDWGYGKLHDGDATFIEGGLGSTNPRTEFFATLLTNEATARRLNAETVGEGMPDLMGTNFDEQFLLVVESRTTAENLSLLAVIPGAIERNGVWSIRAGMVRESTTVPDDVGTDSIVYSGVTVVDRDSLPTPNDARIDVYESVHSNRKVRSFGSD